MALVDAIFRGNPSRLLPTVDWPHSGLDGRLMPDDAQLVDLLGDWFPDEVVRRRTLVDNPTRLYRS